MVWLRFSSHHGPGGGRNWPNGFSYWLLQFGKGYSLPAVVHLHRSVFPFADQGLAFRGPIAPLPGLQLQAASLMSDHPIVANATFGLQPENLSQFAGRRLPPVIVLASRRWAGKASVVLRQVLLFQILVRGFVVVDLLPPQFLDQPILMGPVVALHPALGLGRTGGNDPDAQFLTHAPELRNRDLSSQLLAGRSFSRLYTFFQSV